MTYPKRFFQEGLAWDRNKYLLINLFYRKRLYVLAS
jgi:hypothetical protein